MHSKTQGKQPCPWPERSAPPAISPPLHHFVPCANADTTPCTGASNGPPWSGPCQGLSLRPRAPKHWPRPPEDSAHRPNDSPSAGGSPVSRAPTALPTLGSITPRGQDPSSHPRHPQQPGIPSLAPRWLQLHSNSQPRAGQQKTDLGSPGGGEIHTGEQRTRLSLKSHQNHGCPAAIETEAEWLHS